MFLSISQVCNTPEMDKIYYEVYLNDTRKTILFSGVIARYHELDSDQFTLHHVGGVSAIDPKTLEANYREITGMLKDYLLANNLKILVSVMDRHKIVNKVSIKVKDIDITNNLITLK